MKRNLLPQPPILSKQLSFMLIAGSVQFIEHFRPGNVFLLSNIMDSTNGPASGYRTYF